MKNNQNNLGSGSENQTQNTTVKPVESLDLNAMLNDAGTGRKLQQRVNTSNTALRNEEVNKPVAQETKQLDGLAENNQRIEGFYNELIDKNWGLIERWKDRKMYDLVQAEREKLFTATAGYRLNFYRTLLDARLSSVTEKCNAGLKLIKGHYRQQVASFLMSKMEQLSFEVRDRQFAFLESMKSKYQYAETLTNYPSMHEKYLESIFNEEGKYLAFLDSLLDRFRSVVDEELNKYE